MACRNPSESQELAGLGESAPVSGAPASAEEAREELKSLFRELVALVDSLRAEEAAQQGESASAARVREAREALERSLAQHGLSNLSATAVSQSHGRRQSIKATRRFVATSGASLKATLMFGKR